LQRLLLLLLLLLWQLLLLRWLLLLLLLLPALLKLLHPPQWLVVIRWRLPRRGGVLRCWLLRAVHRLCWCLWIA
jgi:hypothetical protein